MSPALWKKGRCLSSDVLLGKPGGGLILARNMRNKRETSSSPMVPETSPFASRHQGVN